MGLSPFRQPLCHVWQMPDPSPPLFMGRPASMQTSLRWNDDEERRSESLSRQPFAMPAKFLTSALPSFRRRPESSDFNNPFPHSGNDNQNIPACKSN